MTNRVYARPGWKLARQLGGDLFALVWILCWALAARALQHAVGALAAGARASGQAARALGGQMHDAQQKVSSVPAIGQTLAEPFGSLAGGLQDLVAQSDHQVQQITHLATLSGWLCFLVPSAGMLVWWLPRRVRFYRTASAARTLVDSDADLRLFALRAIAHQPLERLARISADPLADWEAGDPVVVRSLARLELESNGLGMPRPVLPGRSGA